MSDHHVAARDAYARRDWPRARELFVTAPEPLSADDLQALSDAAWWLGRIEEALSTSEQAYQRFLGAGRTREAASCALGLAYLHYLRCAEELGSGWLGRGKRLLAEDEDCLESVLLRYVEVEAGLESNDLAPVIAAAMALRSDGLRHKDANLVTAATVVEGRALIKQGAVADGMALLDEAMVDVVTGDLKPDWAGNIYCNVIAACHELVDLKRMWTWTNSLRQWCDGMPSAVLFSGICQVHRAQLFLVRGDPEQAEREAARMCVELADLSVSTTAEAHYVLGEVRRLRGDMAGAERAYRDAQAYGRDPQPGLALLRLACGQVDVAMRSIAAALIAENRGRLARARLCAAQVEIALAADVVESARKAADELGETANGYASPGLRAMAGQGLGAVLLAEGQPEEALAVLREACSGWRALQAVHECAKVRLLLAQAYQVLGDLDAAARERMAAGKALVPVGVATLPLPDGLTAREVEVLALVAGGRTNREVAAELVLSEKTVARHLSNIFAKLGITSRTAAAAYAFDRGIGLAVRG